MISSGFFPEKEGCGAFVASPDVFIGGRRCGGWGWGDVDDEFDAMIVVVVRCHRARRRRILFDCPRPTAKSHGTGTTFYRRPPPPPPTGDHHPTKPDTKLDFFFSSAIESGCRRGQSTLGKDPLGSNTPPTHPLTDLRSGIVFWNESNVAGPWRTEERTVVDGEWSSEIGCLGKRWNENGRMWWEGGR